MLKCCTHRGFWAFQRLRRTWRKNVIPSAFPPAMTDASSLCFPSSILSSYQYPVPPESSVFLPQQDQLCQHTEWFCYLLSLKPKPQTTQHSNSTSCLDPTSSPSYCAISFFPFTANHALARGLVSTFSLAFLYLADIEGAAHSWSPHS